MCAGLFDGAELAISFVHWQDPDGHGEIRLRRGTLGETRLTPQGYFHAELRGLSQPLAQSTLEVFSPNCQADLGEQNEPYTIALLLKGRSGGTGTKHLYRSGSSSTADHILFLTSGTTPNLRHQASGGGARSPSRRPSRS